MSPFLINLALPCLIDQFINQYVVCIFLEGSNRNNYFIFLLDSDAACSIARWDGSTQKPKSNYLGTPGRCLGIDNVYNGLVVLSWYFCALLDYICEIYILPMVARQSSSSMKCMRSIRQP